MHSLTHREVIDLLEMFTNIFTEQAASDSYHYDATPDDPLPAYQCADYVYSGETYGGDRFEYDHDLHFATLIQDSLVEAPTVRGGRRRHLPEHYLNPRPTPLKDALPAVFREDRSQMMSLLSKRLRIKMIRQGRLPPGCTVSELVESGVLDGQQQVSSITPSIQLLPPRPTAPKLLPK